MKESYLIFTLVILTLVSTHVITYQNVSAIEITSSTIGINSNTTNGPDLANGDLFGYSVAGIGDLNNDGTPDIAVGARLDDAAGEDKGVIHVMFMKSDGTVSSIIEISDYTGSGPFLTTYDKFGSSVASIGDLNDDGIPDIAAGATDDDTGGANRGTIHVMFMRSDGTVSSTIEINSNTPSGPSLNNFDGFGSSVASIGDLNDDGIPDIAAGATNDDTGGANRGTIHVMFMNRDGTVSSTVEINSNTPNGPDLVNNNYFGSSVASIGDLNNDGIPDIAAGVSNDNTGGAGRGTIHVMFMNRDGTVSSTVEINSNTPNGPDLSNGDNFGSSVASIGDLNNDGIPDIAAGANYDDAGGTNRGTIHVMLMNRDGTVSDTIEINNSTTNGPDLANGDNFGYSIASIGDLNDDDALDIVSGALYDSTDGSSRGAVHVMLMNSIDTTPPTITAITSNAASLGALKVGDSISFTLTLDPTETGVAINGVYNSQSLIWSTSNNGATYTSTYTISEGDADQATPLQITDVTITDAAGNTSAQKNGTDIQATIDANTPVITSITSNATSFSTLKIGDSISFILTPSSVEAGATINGVYNSQSLIWSTNNNGVIYTATYTISEGETDQATPLQITDVTISDAAGNTSAQKNGTDIQATIDANSPVITSITSNAASLGALKVGDSISFTLTLDSTETGVTINGAYNSQSLIWSTSNNGATYTATYTISEGDADQATSLQITDVTITDTIGNTSAQKSGTDIQATIDANSPVITSITSNATSFSILKVGSSISFTLTPGSTEAGATINGAYNSQSLIWSTSNNGVIYTATYTISEGETDQATPLQITDVTITDAAGNTSAQKNGTYISSSIDANTPVITSITSNATSFSTLKIGDSISFILTPSSVEAGATINGAYNSQSLIWSTNNNGVIYTATYTISEGEADQTTPLQITDVTISDAAGNTSAQKNGTDIQSTIDANSPAITLNGTNPQTIELGTGYTELGATTSDGSQVTINSDEFIDAVGTYSIYYDSADTSGNNATQVVRTVNIVDTTPPVITLNGTNPQTIELGTGYTELGATTNDGSPVTVDTANFTDSVGTYTIYYNSMDAFNNNATQVNRTVNVVDTIPPVITLNGTNPQTIELGAGYTELGATTNDGSQVIINSANFTDSVGTYTIYYDSMDAFNNNATQVNRTVNVVDSTPPVITLNGTNPQTIELGAGYTELGATTNDGSQVIINSANFTDSVGTYTIYYDSTDALGNNATQVNRTVNVVDSTPPVITLNGTNPQTIELGAGYTELGATTNDGSQVIINSANFTDSVGTYTIYYDSTDALGNNATQVNRTVNVVDSTPPVITLNGTNPQTIELGAGYTELGATTSDGSPVSIDSDEFIDTVGTYSIYYDSMDTSGNNATQVVRTVNVVDTIIPSSCIIPDSEDWTITTSCTINSNTTIQGNVLVQNGSVLTIPSGVTLDIDFVSFSLTVQSGSGVYIKSGGTIT